MDNSIKQNTGIVKKGKPLDTYVSDSDYTRCTFKPQINQRSKSVDRKGKNVYDDLYIKAMDSIEKTPEIDEFSFKPEINSEKNNTLLKGKYKFFEKEKKTLEHKQEKVKKIEESEKYSFKPKINTDYAHTGEKKKDNKKNANIRNYEQYNIYQEALMHKKTEKFENEMRGCTFKPQINETKSTEKNSKKVNVYNRLYYVL